MKVTKSQLRQIIKEVAQVTVDEGWWPFGGKDEEPEPEAEREEEERMNPGGDDDEEYEWRRGDMRVKRRHRAKPLYEGKITRKQLKQIIQEELSQVLNEGDVDANADVPPISDEERAQELLNQFKSLLKPEEEQIEGSCGTFLRQLAVLSDRVENHTPANGTNINQ